MGPGSRCGLDGHDEGVIDVGKVVVVGATTVVVVSFVTPSLVARLMTMKMINITTARPSTAAAGQMLVVVVSGG